MILFVGSHLAGPLAVAVADLRAWYQHPDPKARRELADLQAVLTKAATGGQRQTLFDPDDLARQARRMPPLLVTFRDAASMLACSTRTVGRRVEGGELSAVGTGPAARVTVASIASFVTRATSSTSPREDAA